MPTPDRTATELGAGSSETAESRRILVESSRALPLVHLTVAQRTGSSLDPAGKEGLTRLAARLARRTGGGLSAQELDVRVDSLGAALSTEITHSVASFHGSVISRNLDAFVDLLCDVMVKPGLDAEELGRLRRETVADIIESRDNDRALVRRWFGRKLFKNHVYGRPVAGTIHTLEAIGESDVRSHYTSTWVAENLVFAFAGDIDEDRARAVAQRITQALPAGPRRSDSTLDPEIEPGRRLVFVDKPERTQTQILIGGLGTHPRDPDHVALLVGNTVFGGAFTARLMNEVRSKRGWSYGAYSSLPFDRCRQSFSMWVFPKASDAAQCITLELELLRKWREKGITKKELNWAKRFLVRSHAFAIDTASKRVGLVLDSELYELPPEYYESYIERVRAVTLEEVNAAIQTRISDQNLLVTVVGTEKEVGADIRAAIPDLVSSEVIPFDAD